MNPGAALRVYALRGTARLRRKKASLERVPRRIYPNGDSRLTHRMPVCFLPIFQSRHPEMGSTHGRLAAASPNLCHNLRSYFPWLYSATAAGCCWARGVD